MNAEAAPASAEHFTIDDRIFSHGLLEVANRAEALQTGVTVLGVVVETVGSTDMIHFYRDEEHGGIILPSTDTKASKIRDANRRIGERLKRHGNSASGDTHKVRNGRRLRRTIDVEHIQNQFNHEDNDIEVRRVLPFVSEDVDDLGNPRVTVVTVGSPGANGEDTRMIGNGSIVDVEPIEDIILELGMHEEEGTPRDQGSFQWSVLTEAVQLGALYGSRTKTSVFANIAAARRRARNELYATHPRSV